MPAVAVSQIMLEAYKKWLLVGVLANGVVPNLPKYAHNIAHRHFKTICAPYPELAGALTGSKPQTVEALVEKHSEVLQRDRNLGLVLQCAKRMRKANILRLTKTFLTLTLEDVAKRAELHDAREAEDTLLELIRSGEIHAKINQKDGMVQFLDSTEKYTTSAMLVKLQDEVDKCSNIDRHLRELIDDIVTTPAFVTKQMSSDQEVKMSGAGVGF